MKAKSGSKPGPPTVSPYFKECFLSVEFFAASIVSSTAGESTDLPKLSLWVRHQGKQISKSGCVDEKNPANHLGCKKKNTQTQSLNTLRRDPSKNVGCIGPYVYVVLFEVHPIQYPSIAVTPFRWGAIRPPPLSTKRFSSLPRRSCTSAFQRWLLRVGGWWYSSSQLMVNWPKWKI